MKGYSKVIGFVVVAVFAVVATLPVLASDGADHPSTVHRNDTDNISDIGANKRSLKATNKKIHPRILLEGKMKAKFEKEKERDEILAIFGIKGKPVKLACGAADGTYASEETDFDGDYCTGGSLVGADLVFPSPGYSVDWSCTNGKKTIVCSASREGELVPEPQCGAADGTYEYDASDFSGTFCATDNIVYNQPTSLPAPGASVVWTCILDTKDVECSAVVNPWPQPECGAAERTYILSEDGFDTEFCAFGDLVEDELFFPTEPGDVSWSCVNGVEEYVMCSVMVTAVPEPECGAAAQEYSNTTKHPSEEFSNEEFCAIGDLVEDELFFPIPGTTVTWNCLLDEQTTECAASRVNNVPNLNLSALNVIGEESTGKKYAIVVGICDYPDYLEYGDICESDGDAQYMARALHTEYDFPVDNIYLFRDLGEDSVSTGDDDVLSHPASRENIMTAIDTVRTWEESGDEVVFFFSGHGVTGNVKNSVETLDEALLVHNGIENSRPSKLKGQFEYIWDDELKEAFADFDTDRIAFIFDTCKAEGMNDVMGGASTDEYGVGRVFVAASTEEGNAYVYSAGVDGEGLFSHYFVKNGMRGYNGVGGGYADGYNQIGWDSRTVDGWTGIDGTLVDPPVTGQDGYVVIEEAYEYAKEKLAIYFSASLLTQVPVLEDFFTNDLLLGRYVVTE